MSWRIPEPPTLFVGRVGALVVLVVMSLATLAVWWQEIERDRQAIRDHAADVCRQASRRLEIAVEGSLTAASLFGRRWATHEDRDYSKQRFEDFADVMIAEVPGFVSARLIETGDLPAWVAPDHLDSAWQQAQKAEPDLLDRAGDSGSVVLSAPVASNGRVRFFAVLPLETGGKRLGSLVVEFDAHAIIDDGFHDRIRSEFEFEVSDEGRPIYLFAPEGPADVHPYRHLGATWRFAMRNRTWVFEVVPRRQIAAQATGLGSWPVLVLGLLLSAGLAAVVNLLAYRMNMYREAHNQALNEIAERKRAEEALRASEERYRSVFASATDGLLVIDDDDRIVQANPAACAMHGWEPGELDGMEVFELIATSSHHLYTAFKNRPDAAGIFRTAAVHRRTDGTLIDVEVRGSRFRMGAKRRMLAILTDVTERNRAVQRLGMLSRKALMAQEEERARVSRDLHDELGQLLTASRFELGWLQKHAANMPDEVSNALARAIEAVEKSADELRRICRGLRPPLLDDLGLEPAVRLLTQEFEERTALSVDMETQVDEAAPVTMEVALCTYRVLQESLNNVGRHANANHVDVSLIVRTGELQLSVYDDGKGFDVEVLADDGGVGIAGMRERASLVGGSVEIRSAPSEGTRVVLQIPIVRANLENES